MFISCLKPLKLHLQAVKLLRERFLLVVILYYLKRLRPRLILLLAQLPCWATRSFTAQIYTGAVQGL